MKFKKFSGVITIESIFYIAFGLYIFSSVFQLTAWAYSADDSMTMLLWILKAMRYFSYLLFLYKIILHSAHIKKGFLFIICGILLIVLISMAKSSEKEVFLNLLVFWAAKDVSAKRLVRCILKIQVFVLLFTVLCSQIGIVEDYIRIESFRTRHYLGFQWTSLAPVLFFFILLEYMFLKDGRIPFYKYVLLMLVNLWIFKMTGARLMFVAPLTFMTFFQFVYGRVNIAHVERAGGGKLFPFLPWVCAVFSIWCHMAYTPSNPIWEKVNTLLSGRLKLGNTAIKQYGFVLLGQRIEWIGHNIKSVFSKIEGYNYVDSSYLQIALQYGMVFLCLSLLGFSFLMVRAFREKQYYLCWILAVILIDSISEPELITLRYNPFILLCLSSISPKSEDVSGRSLVNKIPANSFQWLEYGDG